MTPPLPQLPIRTTGLDHLGIAVRSVDAAARALGASLGLAPEASELVPSQSVRVCFLALPGVELELLEPTSADGAIARFLEKRGEGLHHVALRVDDVAAALATLRERGVALVDQQPRPGARGRLVAFLHPKSTGGLLVELCQLAPR